MPEDGFEEIAQFVEDELGFATSHYNDRYLHRRFAARMQRVDIEEYDEYLMRLRDDATEQAALLDTLSINVTGFFRNKDVWTGIKDVLREVAAEPGQTSIWSVACADGREAYSLALLAADDPTIDETTVSVLGTDINRHALETARVGQYESSRTVDLDDQLSFLSSYTDYVDHVGDTISVNESIRDRVTFERHDIINDPPKSGFDLVLCRNLFIYIDNEYKRPVVESITDSLTPGGYFIIGKAETLPPQVRSSFITVDGGLRIYRLRG